LQFFERQPCCICKRGYDLFRPPTQCSQCTRLVCGSAACSKLLESLESHPTSCRECWTSYKKSLELMLKSDLSREREERAVIEMCLAERFMRILQPAQPKVNVQQETRIAFDEAEKMMRSRASEKKAPATTAAQPAKAPEQPAKAPEQPAKAPEQPAKAPEQPAKAPEQPVKAPEPVVVVTKAPESAVVREETVVVAREISRQVPPDLQENVPVARENSRPAPPTAAPPPPPAEEHDEGTESEDDAKIESHVTLPPDVAPAALVPQETVAAPVEIKVLKEVSMEATEIRKFLKEIEAVEVSRVSLVKETTEVASVSIVSEVEETKVEPPPAAAGVAAGETAADGKVDEDSEELSTDDDEKVEKADPSCTVCRESFNIFRREKQCSECSKAVCNQCVGFFRLRSLQDNKPRYICFTCLPGVRARVVDPKFEGAELVRASREAAAVDLLLAGNLHQHFVSTDFSPTELSEMKSGELVCARSGDKFDYSRPPRRCTDCNKACTARDCRNFDWVARILQRQMPSTLCRSCWPTVREELIAKASADPETEARVADEVQIGDSFFALNRLTDFANPPKVDRGVRCNSCQKKFSNFRIPQQCCNCSELVCTGVACSGRFLVPEVSLVRPSVVCAACIHKVKLSRPKPGQLTSQQDNPLNASQAEAVLSNATCKQCSKGFSFWMRPHECPSCGDNVHVSCCKIHHKNVECLSCAGVSNAPVTMAAVVAHEEESEPLSETDTDASEKESKKAPKSAQTPSSGAPIVVSPPAKPAEEDTSTSTTEEAEETKKAALSAGTAPADGAPASPQPAASMHVEKVSGAFWSLPCYRLFALSYSVRMFSSRSHLTWSQVDPRHVTRRSRVRRRRARQVHQRSTLCSHSRAYRNPQSSAPALSRTEVLP
jgi:hypothetical protein